MYGFSRHILLALGVCVVSIGCSSDGTEGDEMATERPREATAEAPTAADLIPTEDGKSDLYGRAFDPNNLMDDDVFEDAYYMTEAELDAFLAKTPYRTRSFLADYVVGGRSAANLIIDAATTYRINPLVLLTKLQVETSLIFKTNTPSDHTINRAMGCGCPDNDPACTNAPRGLHGQVKCAARLFRQYLVELKSRNQTVSGWGVGRGKESVEETIVTPANKATAALYTYTPWVLPGQGGNWLFWNVLRKFSRFFLMTHRNHRWIGAPCTDSIECGFEDARCAADESATDESVGVCTLDCETTCPDTAQPFSANTVCMARETTNFPTELTGSCGARCDTRLFGDGDGCPPSFECIRSHRPGQTQVLEVCVPLKADAP
ncbi:MAG: hypothetical protein VX589_17635 [Myxococcota bacterium]|nr:hypothetical protein [Myxococcota bacterium]